MTKTAVLITGASTGIGATYADRFARRGHDLVLVARDKARLRDVATRLAGLTGVNVDILQADLTREDDLVAVEARLREDDSIATLVNNAGAGLGGSFLNQPTEAVVQLVTLNVTSVARLASAISPRLAARGEGAIINIGSVVGLAPELGMSVYGATKAFVLSLSQGLAGELGPRGVYVQAVLPAATRTELWGRAGADVASLPPMMDVEDLVDAALAGFDLREGITIPPLHDGALWDAFEAARQAMLPGFGEVRPAARYVSAGNL